MTDHPATVDRIDILSSDGTPIAVWVEGSGPPMVLVHGSIADHTTFDPFVEVVRHHFTTFSMDRRGFGASGDTTTYSIERDFDDVAIVVDAVAARTGDEVALWGHSYGANCAMGGATLTTNVGHLVLYEPSLGLQYPPGSIARIEAHLEAGNREAAIVAVLVDILEMTDDEIDTFRTNALWPLRVASAHTVPRECHVEAEWTYGPGQFAAITAPTLFLSGSDSVPSVVTATHDAARAIPHARIVTLDGHGHFGHKTDPVLVTDIIRQFVAQRPTPSCHPRRKPSWRSPS